MANRKKCKVDDCERPSKSLGFCNSHYERNKRYGDPLMGRTPNGEQHNWIDKHAGHSGSECLKWPYSTARGYGYCHIDGKYASVSRHMCKIRNEAAHICGNGHLGCVNPSHLEWKTSAENKEDQLRHGTRRRGEMKKSKLTTEAVRDIRRRVAESNITQVELSSEYGVTSSAIQSVVSRRTWAWLD